MELLRRVGPLMAGLGQDDEFRTYLLEVRGRHSRKRNLIKRLDRLAATTAAGQHG